MAIKVRSFSGEAILPFLPELARLRISVFREWPYLYEGTLEYEQEYLQTYVKAPQSVLVIAFDDDKVIGASTALPMHNETPNVQAPFVANGYDIGQIFYYGESVLDAKYRGRGIGVEFFNHRETWARSQVGFAWAAFCGVVRPEDHPLKPAGYTPLDAFWRKRGFSPTELYCHMDWLDVNEKEETSKPLRFWLKSLV